MKLTPASFRAGNRRRGWALLAVMTLAACGLMALAGVMSWANANATDAARNNEYFATSYAAESATEKVLSSIFQQYENWGFPTVISNMSAYPTNIPTASDGAYWTNYQFSGGHTVNQIIVTNTATSQTITEGAPYTGLTLTANIYEIIANAQNTTSEFKIVSTVGQQVYLGTIPLFQFAIFYQYNMEIAPGATMSITGPVHGNTNIYLSPNSGVTLTLNNTISAVGQVIQGQDPQNMNSLPSSFGTVVFDGTPTEQNGVPPLNLPVGTNATGVGTNDSQNVYAILEPPQAGQGPTSPTGTNLLYNQADLIIIISNNNTIRVTSGADINNQATVISNSQWSSWLSTNGTFYDQRDSLTVQPVVINVSNLVTWSSNTSSSVNPMYSVLQSLRGSSEANIQSIYVDDQRSTSNAVVTTNITIGTNYSTNTTTTSGYPSSGNYVPPVTTTNYSYSTNIITHKVTTNIVSYTYQGITSTLSTNTSYTTNYVAGTVQPGIVLSNGAVLPPNGLSIATPDPAYIIGNWNVQLSSSGTSDAGTSGVTYTRPSAIYADAITILSPAWNPANSTLAISSRTATSDTVNAAFLTGNVPSNGSDVAPGYGYSGGVENFPRFLENWSGQNFYYNGSMVCMFNSQIANAAWPGTGTVYNPPNRYWSFDVNFNNPSQQPPMMPRITIVQRSQWTLLSPYTTSF
jgi:hypothetical protein